jgi:transcriptional regulator with XRE-family HTH domain
MARPPLDAAIGQRARRARLKVRRTQRELAVWVGCNVRLYSLFETGQRRVCLEDLIRICYLLDVSSDVLLGLVAEDEPSGDDAHTALHTGPGDRKTPQAIEPPHGRGQSAPASHEMSFAH